VRIGASVESVVRLYWKTAGADVGKVAYELCGI
jgi:hypothetical protein